MFSWSKRKLKSVGWKKCKDRIPRISIVCDDKKQTKFARNFNLDFLKLMKHFCHFLLSNNNISKKEINYWDDTSKFSKIRTNIDLRRIETIQTYSYACKWFRHEDQFRCKKRKRERRIKKIYGSSGERRNIFVITVIRDRVRGEKLPGGRKGRKNWLSKKSSSLAVGHRSSPRCLVTASAPLWISPPVNGYS